jgi:hypothetical protein
MQAMCDKRRMESDVLPSNKTDRALPGEQPIVEFVGQRSMDLLPIQLCPVVVVCVLRVVF